MIVKLDTVKLDQMIKDMPAEFVKVVTKNANRILASARIDAPRDPKRPPKNPSRQVTGALKANSDVVKVDIQGLTQSINFYQEYALAQELGRPEINLPARPYLTPAVEKDEKQFVKDIAEVIK